MFFRDRTEAGDYLAEKLLSTKRDFSQHQLLGLARGGVIVAAPVARVLGLKLQSLIVDDLRTDTYQVTVTSFLSGLIYKPAEKKPAQWHDDLRPLSQELDGLADFLDFVRKRHLLYNLQQDYSVSEKVLLVDDGIVTGQSALIAARALRLAGAREIVLAVPVTCAAISKISLGFEIISWRQSMFDNRPTGLFYFNFPDTKDEEVIQAVA